MLKSLAFLVVAASLILGGCGKSSDNGTTLQQGVNPQDDVTNQDTNNVPDLEDEWVAEETQQNTQFGNLSQMVVVIREDGLRYVQLVAGPSVNFQGQMFWNVVGESLFDGFNLRTVYMNNFGTRLIIMGNVNTQSAIANCNVFTQNPNGVQNDVTTFQYRRAKFKPMRRRAYNQCREFFPPSLDRLDRRNRRQRWACQRKVARTVFADERRWNPWGNDNGN